MSRDANDILREEGPARLRAVIDSATAEPMPPRLNGAHRKSARVALKTGAARFHPVLLDEIEIEDDPVYLVEGLLPAGPSLGVTFGPPKTLKSFLLAHVSLHIAANMPFCGRQVQHGAVVYVTSEGVRGVKRRLIASRRQLGLEGRKIPFALIPVMPNLGTGVEDREQMSTQIAGKLKLLDVPLRLIVIDTLRRAIPGKSENKQEDMSIFVDNCEALARAFDCHVMVVHHSPRSDDQRGSGSNSLDAAADVMWSVVRDESSGKSTATVVRMKDGEEGDQWSFELSTLKIGTDRNGSPIVSCYVEITSEPTRTTDTGKARPAKLPPAQQRFFDIVLRATTEAGATVPTSSLVPQGARAITRDTLKAYCRTGGWWDPEDEHNSRSKFSGRLNELAGKKVIGITAEHVWVVRP